MKLKEAMKLAKKTKKPQKVTEPSNADDVKVNISIRLDLEILKLIKAEAKQKALPYQSLINSILKQHVDMQQLLNGMPIDKVIPEMLKRIEKLEQEIVG